MSLLWRNRTQVDGAVNGTNAPEPVTVIDLRDQLLSVYDRTYQQAMARYAVPDRQDVPAVQGLSAEEQAAWDDLDVRMTQAHADAAQVLPQRAADRAALERDLSRLMAIALGPGSNLPMAGLGDGTANESLLQRLARVRAESGSPAPAPPVAGPVITGTVMYQVAPPSGSLAERLMHTRQLRTE